MLFNCYEHLAIQELGLAPSVVAVPCRLSRSVFKLHQSTRTKGEKRESVETLAAALD